MSSKSQGSTKRRSSSKSKSSKSHMKLSISQDEEEKKFLRKKRSKSAMDVTKYSDILCSEYRTLGFVLFF